MIPDIKNFTKKKLSTILHNVMTEWDSKWTSITELGTLDEFYGEIIGRLWEKTLIYCKSLCPPVDGCSAEEVVAAIIRKGLKKEAIKFKGSSFILMLPNHTYEVKKYEGRFNARPEHGRFSYQDYSPRWISMEKNAFAEFLFEFDTILPQVIERISQCVAAWMPHIRRQCRIADEINVLSEKYLKGEGIRYEIQVFRNGNPRIQFSKGAILPMTKEVKPEELEDFFREVPMLMKKRPVCGSYYMLGRDSGTVTAYVDWNALPKDDRMALIDYFTKDDNHTHSRISHLSREQAEDGTVRICFDFDQFDWIHMFWDIEQKFPNLKATYMVTTAGYHVFFRPVSLFTNDTGGKYFKVEDRKVKVYNDLHEIRQDCDVDKTKGMTRLTLNEQEWCDVFVDDDEDTIKIY